MAWRADCSNSADMNRRVRFRVKSLGLKGQGLGLKGQGLGLKGQGLRQGLRTLGLNGQGVRARMLGL
jgi:hypothetical protein